MYNRNIVVYNEKERLVRVGLFTGQEMANYCQKFKGNYQIDFLGDISTNLDDLIDGSEEFLFYIDPDDMFLIDTIDIKDYDDSYYSEAVVGYSDDVSWLVGQCLGRLYNSRLCSPDDLLYLSLNPRKKGKEVSFTLYRFDKSLGTVDFNDSDDKDFKRMILAIFREKGPQGIIVLPCSGVTFLFENELVCYRDKETFKKALKGSHYSIKNMKRYLKESHRYKKYNSFDSTIG